jgi:glycosyltransferase involved in cell wall biosynthesis
MRALLITDWMRWAGGVECFVAWVRDALRARGDDVRLLTSTAGSAADGAADYRAFGTERRAAQAFLQLVNPSAVLTVRRAVRSFRPDVVMVNMFAHHLSPAIFSELRAVPTFLSVTDYKCVCPISYKLLPDGRLCTERAGAICWRYGCVSLPHWLRDRPRYALIRAGLRTVDRVLACSQWVQRELAADGLQSEHLPLPVPQPGFGFRRSPSVEPLFVYSGRLDVEKGVDLLLRAFARVRDVVPAARLRIVGTGPRRSELEQLSAALGLKPAVTFQGRVSPEQVERELTDAWALVAPSLWAEPFGLVAVEAIVRGVPVVASANGGFGETVEPGLSGLLFPNGDEEALGAALRAIARGEAFPGHAVPDEVVRRAQEQHSMDRYVNRLRAVFREVADPVAAHL